MSLIWCVGTGVKIALLVTLRQLLAVHARCPLSIRNEMQCQCFALVQAAEFASGLEKLTTMGFPLPLAAGALAKHKGNLEAATESCLSTAS